MLNNYVIKVINDDIKYQRIEQLKRDLIKAAQKADKAKWAMLSKQKDSEK